MDKTTEPEVHHNEPGKRFELTIDGKTARTEYMKVGEKIIFSHTEVPVGLEGRGIASKLVKAGLAYARENKLVVMPICPFFAGYLLRHPEDQDLLAPGFRIGS